jgi:uncharacterized cupredoxin-like copper-binding protein
LLEGPPGQLPWPCQRGSPKIARGNSGGRCFVSILGGNEQAQETWCLVGVFDQLRGINMNRVRMSFVGVAVLLAAFAWTVAASAHSGTAKAGVVSVTTGKPTEFSFTLSTKSIKTGATTFKITNKGALAHTFKVCSSSKGGSANSCAGTGTPSIAPGKSATLKIVFSKKGTYEYLCTVPSHAASGMKGDLKVT